MSILDWKWPKHITGNIRILQLPTAKSITTELIDTTVINNLATGPFNYGNSNPKQRAERQEGISTFLYTQKTLTSLKAPTTHTHAHVHTQNSS